MTDLTVTDQVRMGHLCMLHKQQGDQNKFNVNLKVSFNPRRILVKFF
jgi:hypothetical protein